MKKSLFILCILFSCKSTIHKSNFTYQNEQHPSKTDNDQSQRFTSNSESVDLHTHTNSNNHTNKKTLPDDLKKDNPQLHDLGQQHLIMMKKVHEKILFQMQFNDTSQIKTLLKQCPNFVNYKVNSDNANFMIHLIWELPVELVRYQDRERQYYYDILKYILDVEVLNINDTNCYGWSALHTAVYINNKRIVEMLIDKGIDLQLKTTKEFRGVAPGLTAIDIYNNFSEDRKLDPKIRELLLK